MAQQLPRGGNFSFTKWNPFVKELTVVFNWRVMRGNSDLVPHILPLVIPCDGRGKAMDSKSMIFGNQLTLTDNPSVVYRGDGPDDGGDSVTLNLSRIPSQVEKIFFLLLVNPDVRVPSTFDTIRSVSVDVHNRDGEKIVAYPLGDEETRGKPVMEVCEIYRFRDEWKFRANSAAYTNFIDVERKFGVEF